MHLYSYCTCWSLAGNHRSNNTGILGHNIYKSGTYYWECNLENVTLQIAVVQSAREEMHHSVGVVWNTEIAQRRSWDCCSQREQNQMITRFNLSLTTSFSYDPQLMTFCILISQKRQSVPVFLSPYFNLNPTLSLTWIQPLNSSTLDHNLTYTLTPTA